jgi:DNA-binding CsgD family transcriptional regulator
MRNTVAELRRRVAQLELDCHATAGALDCLPIGVIVADRTGMVLHANRTVRLLAQRTNRPLLVGDAGNEQRVDAAWFEGVVAPLFHPSRAIHRPVVVTLPTRSGGPPLHGLVAPLPGEDVAADTDAPAAVMIFVSDPGGHVDTNEPTVRSLFKLTRTEARIAGLLANGVAVRDIAARLGIAPATARWHVKRLLTKTGTSSQRQLACVLLGGVASLRQD